MSLLSFLNIWNTTVIVVLTLLSANPNICVSTGLVLVVYLLLMHCIFQLLCLLVNFCIGFQTVWLLPVRCWILEAFSGTQVSHLEIVWSSRHRLKDFPGGTGAVLCLERVTPTPEGRPVGGLCPRPRTGGFPDTGGQTLAPNTGPSFSWFCPRLTQLPKSSSLSGLPQPWKAPLWSQGSHMLLSPLQFAGLMFSPPQLHPQPGSRGFVCIPLLAPGQQLGWS